MFSKEVLIRLTYMEFRNLCKVGKSICFMTGNLPMPKTFSASFPAHFRTAETSSAAELTTSLSRQTSAHRSSGNWGKSDSAIMMFTNPSQYYNTRTTDYNHVSATCRIMVMSLTRYNILSVMQS